MSNDLRAQWRAAWGMARRMVRGKLQPRLETSDSILLDVPSAPRNADERLALFASHAMRRGLHHRLVQTAGMVAYLTRISRGNTTVVGSEGDKVVLRVDRLTFDPLARTNFHRAQRAFNARLRREARQRRAA